VSGLLLEMGVTVEGADWEIVDKIYQMGFKIMKNIHILN
jgi:hypothetical protein